MNADDENILARGRVATRLQAQDLDRARRFSSEQLGLEPVDERPGGLLYRCGGVEFALFESTGASSASSESAGPQMPCGANTPVCPPSPASRATTAAVARSCTSSFAKIRET